MTASLKKANVSLSSASVGKDNNLDFLRFIAAAMVIFCHAFPLSYGKGGADPFFLFSKHQMNSGGFAVSIFFLYGGFLISGSTVRSKTAKRYFASRCFRIFPALIFVTFTLTFIVGPLITSLNLKEYFTSFATYKYLLNSILIIQHDLPGVFASNPYGPTVNGPLWTLPIEFLCYILCFIAYKLGFFERRRFPASVPLVVAACIGILYAGNFSETIVTEIRPAILFYIGVGCYIYRDKIILNKYIAVVLGVVMVIFARFGLINLAMLLCFPYCMLSAAYATRRKLSRFAKHGEFSYGIYLWGWPVQQIIVSIAGENMSPYLNALSAFPFALLMGVLSYYLVEKPALKLRRRLMQ